MREAGGGIVGVLDVDSHHANHFSETHRSGYETIVRLLEERWRG